MSTSPALRFRILKKWRADGAPRRAGFPPEPTADDRPVAGTPYIFVLIPSVRTVALSRRYPTRREPPKLNGRTHLKDFALIFCANGCGNLCEIEFSQEIKIDSVCPHTTFTCRACRTVAAGPRFQPHQFDKKLPGGIPEGTEHIRNQGHGSAKKLLRKLFDKNDTMITGGQTLKKRLIERPCPDWMLDDNKVREFLLSKFPSMLSAYCEPDCKHRACQRVREQWNNAALWLGVIYFYHRLGLPASEVAAELTLGVPVEATSGELKPSTEIIERIILQIRRRRTGLRASGKPFSNGKRGRKKKTITLPEVAHTANLIIVMGV